MNNIDKEYKKLLNHILTNGVDKEDRTGTGTLSVFGYQLKHKMSEGFPLLTTKKMAWKQIVTELLWFLRGETNIQSLVREGNNIWVGDAYKYYQKHVIYSSRADDRNVLSIKPHDTIDGLGEFKVGNEFTKLEFIDKIKNDDSFAHRWGNMGPIYGKQWRSWSEVDQIKVLVEKLLSEPDSRRLMVSAWNVEQLEGMKLPPCHYGFQLYTRKLTESELEDLDWEGVKPTRAISLMWNQRSVDTFLGLPFNIASYGLLLVILAKLTNMVPDELIGNLGDTHLYLNHIEQALEQLNNEPYELANLVISESANELFDKYLGNDILVVNGVEVNSHDYGYYKQINNVINALKHSDFTIPDYESHDKITAPLSN